jgi:FkbM family methyltransferase
MSLVQAIRLFREPWRGQFHRAYAAWLRDRGDLWRMRVSGLGAGARVLDFGGYEGAWTDAIRRIHGARVEVFEPHPRFAAALAARFASDRAVTVNPFALGEADGPLWLSDGSDGSSAVVGAAAVQGQQRAAAAYFAEHPGAVALAKVNIEGGEYTLLPALHRADVLRQIEVLQVQFHLYKQDDIAARAAIRRMLEQTHRCDWEYPFVWEQWSLRRDRGAA